MKKFYFFLLLVYFFFFIASAQQITFDKQYWSLFAKLENANTVVETPDSCYLVGGDNFLMKIDTLGSVIWNKIFYDGNLSPVEVKKIELTDDSSYVLLSSNGLIKLDKTFSILWSNELLYNNLSMIDFTQTLDSGFLCVGNVGYNMIYISRFDSVGNLLWSKKITTQNSLDYIGNSIKENIDSTIIISAYFGSSTSYKTQLIKLTKTGNLIWVKDFQHQEPDPYIEFYNEVLITQNGYLLFIPNTNSGYTFLLQTDFDGNIVWSKKYSGLGVSEFMLSNTNNIIETSDSSFVFANGDQMASYPFGLIAKVDKSGNLIWVNEIYSTCNNIIETSDKGFLILGDGPFAGLKLSSYEGIQIGISKTDSLGNSQCTQAFQSTSTLATFLVTNPTVSINAGTNSAFSILQVGTIATITSVGCIPMIGSVSEINNTSLMHIYPNPASNQLTIKLNDYNSTLSKIKVAITNMLGQTILSNNYTFINNEVVIDISQLPNNALYIIMLESDKNNIFKTKFIKQ